MIKLCVTAPLPNILGLSHDSTKLNLNIPYFEGINVEKIFMYLAENYPDFALIYNDKNSRLLSSLIITTDDKILYSHDLRKKSLDDGSEIKFFSPYEGG